MHDATSKQRKREQGLALLATVLLLLMLASLGLASLNVVERDQQVAGHMNRKAIALHAADAAVAKALETLQNTGTPSVPVTTLGDPAMHPHGRPSYRLDPSVADPIDDIGEGTPDEMALNVGGQGAGAAYQVQYWKLNVQGEAPGGTLARVEAVTGALVTN